MELDRFPNIPYLTWLFVCSGFGVVWLARIKYQSGFSRFNGPFLASFTNLWRLWQAYWWTDRVVYEALPAKYGNIIRIGPSVLLFSEPEAVKEIYSAGFGKSEQYTASMGVSKGITVPNLFSSTDKEWHGKLRRCVSSAFSMSTLIHYERFVDHSVEVFLGQIHERFANSGGVTDLANWTRFFALDVIAELSYGKSYGLLEAGRDEFGLLTSKTNAFRYISVVGQIPVLDKLLYKNPILLWLGRKGWYNKTLPTVPIALAQLVARLQLLNEEKKGGKDESSGTRPKQEDLLAKFLRAKDENPDFVDDKTVLGLILSMVNAGSGTIATTLAALFYHLLKRPELLGKLIAEIDAHFPQAYYNTTSSQSFKDFLIPFSEAQKLPYLDACIKETFRYHPALAGQPLERVVPPGGATLRGQWIPAGTIVCSTAWIVHRHKPTFGDDADEFRPERWLECSREQLVSMNKHLFTFGAGPHTCIGKSIALLEIYKVVPSLLRAFETTLDDPSKSWKLFNVGDVEPSEVLVRFKRRYSY